MLERLTEVHDRAGELDLLKRAIRCESITSNETGFAALLKDEMGARNFAPQISGFLPDRPNIWGERKGGGEGASLQFIGHTDVVTAGATDEFERLGIEVVAATSAAFEDAKENGVALVVLSNLPQRYEHPADYASIVTDDLFDMGKRAADALAAAIGERGTVGWIFHDADYYVTNQRDIAFKATIENDYPNIKIVTEQGISDPARAEEIANAMLLQNPDLSGIYVTWAGPAEGVLAALRANDNDTIKIVTLDLSEPVALDMVKGGNVAALVADEAYELGRAMAAAGARALAGEDTPPFVIAPALTVTADTVEEGWMTSLRIEAPASLRGN